MKCKWLSLLVAAMLLCAAIVPAAGLAQAAEGDAFAIAGVEIQSDRVAMVRFNAPMHGDFYDFMSQSPNYFDKWIRIEGGVAGEADAALQGNLVDGAHTYPTEDRMGFELCLNEGFAFVAGRDYAISFDLSPFTAKNTGLAQSIATFAKDEGGRVIDTAPFAFSAQAVAPVAPLAIKALASRDTSSVDVLFDARVVSGLPLRKNAAKNLAIKAVPVAGGATVPAVYAEPIAGSEGRRYVLYFAQPLEAGAEYALQFSQDLNIAGPAGNAGAFEQNFTVSPDELDYAIESIVLDARGAKESLTIALDRPIEAFKKADGSYESLIETPVAGAVGNHLTRADVAAIFDFHGVAAADGRELFDALGEIPGYFADSKTIVLHNDNVFSFALAEDAAVSLKEGALRNFSTAVNRAGQAVKVAAGAVEAGPQGYLPDGEDYLKMSTQTITYRTFDYLYDQYDDPDGEADPNVPGHHPPVEGIDPNLQIVGRSNYHLEDIVDRTFDTYVVENKYIKATFLPSFGGRMLSLIYKPTGNDLLYLNPVGVPYGEGFANDTDDPSKTPGTAPFYSNWLMVWGGVFPTFPTAEHGKYWYLPWDYEIEESDEAITIAMHRKDDVDYLTTNPDRFLPDHTNLDVYVDYVVYKDKPYVDMKVAIQNPAGNGDKIFEYWTCTTLAPGEDTYDGSPTMEIVAPTQIMYRDGYGWMGAVDRQAFPEGTPWDELPQYVKDNALTNGLEFNNTQDSYMIYDKLSKFRHWKSSGIGYAMDQARLPQANWWGVVNQENQEGVLRLGDNRQTPGTKYWLWSYDSSFDTKPYGSGSSARPYIELWGGASNRFFGNRYIKDGETISWTETFMPTAGLTNVTNAGKGGAAEVRFAAQGSVYRAEADVFSTAIGKQLRAVLRSEQEVLAEETFTAQALAKHTIKGVRTVPAGAKVTIEVYDGNEMILSAYAIQGGKVEPEPVAVEAFQLNEREMVIEKGEQFKLFGIIDPFHADTSNIVWNSTNSSVASVEGYSYTRPSFAEGERRNTSLITHRVVTGNRGGKAAITATVNDPVSGKTFRATCDVLVVEPLKELSFSSAEFHARKSGERLNLKDSLRYAPSDAAAAAQVTWTSDDADVAAVDENGVITALKPGTATITAQAGEGVAAQATVYVTE